MPIIISKNKTIGYKDIMVKVNLDKNNIKSIINMEITPKSGFKLKYKISPSLENRLGLIYKQIVYLKGLSTTVTISESSIKEAVLLYDCFTLCLFKEVIEFKSLSSSIGIISYTFL